MKKIIYKIIGESSKTPLKQRMANTALLLNILYGLITIPANIILKLPLFSTLTLTLTVILFLTLYYFSRFKNKTEICVDIAIVYTFVLFTPVMWFTNNGLDGGFQYYIFLFGAFTLAVTEGKKLFFFLLLLFIVSVSLITIGYIHPEYVTKYPTKQDQFADMLTSFVLVFAGVLFLMYYFTNQFHKYNEKLNESNLKLISANSQLSDRLKEREILIHEVHHRVKNNLQMVSGLLRLQYNTIKDKDLGNSLQISQERIDAISIVHELLYKSDNLKFIDIKEYTENLVKNIKISSFTDKKNITINLHSEHSIIKIGKLISYGLILNELISNSIKHAFKNTGGLITVNGHVCDNNYSVLVKDNGKGLPEEFESDKLNSLGFKLINGLCEQLNSELKINKLKQGSEFVFEFKIS